MPDGWKLTPACRERLLSMFPPRYPAAVADRATSLGGVGARGALPPEAVAEAAIVGRAGDDAGVEAYVVAIDGSMLRPDGSTWHVAWPLGPGRKASESDEVIAAGASTARDRVMLEMVPASW